MNKKETNVAELRPVGRPRLLTREQVIAAAISIGTDNITMKRVAETLGVGVATLYKYVTGSKELMQLVTDELMSTVGLPEPGDLSWFEYARAYCLTLQQSMIDQPSVIQQLLNGGFGHGISNRLRQDFIRSIVGITDDLSVEQADQLYQGLCQIAVGGAVTSVALKTRQRPDMASDKQQNPDSKAAPQFALAAPGEFFSTSLLLDALIDRIIRIQRK